MLKLLRNIENFGRVSLKTPDAALCSYLIIILETET